VSSGVLVAVGSAVGVNVGVGSGVLVAVGSGVKVSVGVGGSTVVSLTKRPLYLVPANRYWAVGSRSRQSQSSYRGCWNACTPQSPIAASVCRAIDSLVLYSSEDDAIGVVIWRNGQAEHVLAVQAYGIERSANATIL